MFIVKLIDNAVRFGCAVPLAVTATFVIVVLCILSK